MGRKPLQTLKGYKHQDQGLVIFYTGYGKGKTSAAIHLAFRAAGYGHNVKIIQFIKGEWPSGEKNFLQALQQSKVESVGTIDFQQVGQGFVKILGDQKPFAIHQQAALSGLEQAGKDMQSGKYYLLILDELVSAVEEKLLSEQQVLDFIAQKPAKLTLVITGHKKYPRIIAKCDLVTEMRKLKHPFDKGILAKKGIDY